MGDNQWLGPLQLRVLQAIPLRYSSCKARNETPRMDEKRETRDRSPLWHRALDRYRKDLKNQSDLSFISEIASLDDVVAAFSTMADSIPGETNRVNSRYRLDKTLKLVDDFAAILAVCFGADTKLTAVVWGSIRLILSLASSTADTLIDVLRMIEELAQLLPQFQSYERDLPLHSDLETALVEVYTQVICFYARCIHFFRKHPKIKMDRPAWQAIRSDFTETVNKIRELSRIIDREVDRLRMRRDGGGGYKEVLELLAAMNAKEKDKPSPPTVHQIPSKLTPRFWGREDVLTAVSEALSIEGKRLKPLSFALVGMGGVGKTQIALEFANRHREVFPTILWISADTSISVAEGFRDAAKALDLLHTKDELQDSVLAILRVKKWLLDSTSPWLLVFDNADDLEVLHNVWPAAGYGSILLTSRDAEAVFTTAASGLMVQPFSSSDGGQVLLKYAGRDGSVESTRQEAVKIAEALGGLPLALGQIGGYIARRKIPLMDFLPLYERNFATIEAQKIGLKEYEHTLSTVWSMSIARLAPDSLSLLHQLSYLHPDAIDEDVLLRSASRPAVEQPSFLQDRFFEDAEVELTKVGLIAKTEETAQLSLHRLIQAMVIRSQANCEQSETFSSTVSLLLAGFPDTSIMNLGHQYRTWASCQKFLPHVHHLIALKARFTIDLQDKNQYAELLRRGAKYLYEREQYNLATELMKAAVETFADRTSTEYIAALSLSGHIDLDLDQPLRALSSFRETQRIYEAQGAPSPQRTASILNNIGIAQTELNELKQAYETHQAALALRISTGERVGNSLNNLASLALRMNRPDEAEGYLQRCGDYSDLDDEAILASGNPRNSGTMVLLSRIRFAQARVADALRLATKALTFRRAVLGNRLKTCDSLFDVAFFLSKQGKVASAIDFLEQLVEVAAIIPEGKGQLARAHWLLSVLHGEQGREDDGAEHAVLAKRVRAAYRPDLNDAPFEEAEFRRLCVWMLW